MTFERFNVILLAFTDDVQSDIHQERLERYQRLATLARQHAQLDYSAPVPFASAAVSLNSLT